MSGRWIAIVLLSLLSGIPALVAAAPLGRSFTYQGQLSQSGVPLDGLVHLRFSLWDAPGTGEPPTGGNAVGSPQVRAGIPVVAGVFTVDVNGDGAFGAQAFSGEARWLQVEVCADSACSSSTPLGPRQALTAAPYALGPWQASAFGLSYSGSNVGIGTSMPQAALEVDGTIRWGGTATEYARSVIDGSGLLLEHKGEGTVRSRMRLQSSLGGDQTNFAQFNIDPEQGFSFVRVGVANHNVGVGVLAPTERLDVRGNIKFGSAGEYFAPGSPEKLRVLRGRVSAAGAVLDGSGFTASRISTGVYVMTFSPAFAVGGTPSITASAESSGAAKFAMVSTPLPTSTRILVVNGSGTPLDSDFHFIAIGAR